MFRRAALWKCAAGIAAAAAPSAAAAAPPATAATAAALPSGAAQQLSETQKAFLNTFRERLDKDPDAADLDTYVPEAQAAAAGPLGTAAGLSAAQVKRGVEPLPPWLKLKLPKGESERPKYNAIKKSLSQKKLATVCQEAKCPNIGECWGGGEGEAATATIMLMGTHCTRGCRFCSVGTMRNPPPLDPEEPENVASAINEMGVDYIVITMVDRDDLPDGGAAHVASCIRKVKEKSSGKLLVECLAGDFRGNFAHVETLVDTGLEVYAHNVECVERITPNVRDRRASYRQTLAVLEHAAKHRPSVLTKSSIMLGLGEEEAEVRQTLRDLRTAGVSCVTLGQYLQPSRTRLKVSRYAHPTEFEMWEKEAVAMGYLYCASGPMVRSSYRAGEFYIKNALRARATGGAATA